MKKNLKSKLIILLLIQSLLLANIPSAYCDLRAPACLGQAISLSMPGIHSGFKQALESTRFKPIFNKKAPYAVLSFAFAALGLIISYFPNTAKGSVDYRNTIPIPSLRENLNKPLFKEQAKYSLSELDKTVFTGYSVVLDGIKTNDILLSYAGPFILLMFPSDNPGNTMIMTMFWGELLERSFQFPYKGNTYSISMNQDQEIIISRKIDIKISPEQAKDFKAIPEEIIQSIPAWKIVEATVKTSLEFKCRKSSYFVRLCDIYGKTKMLLLQKTQNKIFDYLIDLESLIETPMLIKPKLSAYQLGITCKYSELNRTYTFSFTEFPLSSKLNKEKQDRIPQAKNINSQMQYSAIGCSI